MTERIQRLAEKFYVHPDTGKVYIKASSKEVTSLWQSRSRTPLPDSQRSICLQMPASEYGPAIKERAENFVMMQALGRELLPDERAHHINGDRRDNRLANLYLLHKRPAILYRVPDYGSSYKRDHTLTMEDSVFTRRLYQFIVTDNPYTPASVTRVGDKLVYEGHWNIEGVPYEDEDANNPVVAAGLVYKKLFYTSKGRQDDPWVDRTTGETVVFTDPVPLDKLANVFSGLPQYPEEKIIDAQKTVLRLNPQPTFES